MTAITNVFHAVAESKTDLETLKMIAMFCAAGLFVSLLLATYGLDLSPVLF